ncbi:MAG: hypothetical protein ABIJ27_05980 [Candidatus Omnitrophota bacterium]
MAKRSLIGALCVALISFSIFGCGKSADKGKVLAVVNGEPLYVDELNRTLAINVRRDPLSSVTPQTLKTYVDLLIDKKLLIQQARKNDLDQADRFVNTIKTFWEQTLIRELITAKDKEFDTSVTVHEEEIRDYYGKLSRQITCRIAKNVDRTELEALAEQDPNTVPWDNTVGPITLRDALSPVIATAFDIPKGESVIIRGNDAFYLIYVQDSNKVPAEPLDKIKGEIKERVIQSRKKELFEAWLSSLRDNADVRVNDNVIKQFQYEGK